MRTVEELCKYVTELQEVDAIIVDINQRIYAGTGNTVLHYYCFWDDLEAVEILLENGANPNSLGEDEMTPLFNAIRGGHVRMVERLLGAGADANHQEDYLKMTPLDTAFLGLRTKPDKKKDMETIIDILKQQGGYTQEELRNG